MRSDGALAAEGLLVGACGLSTSKTDKRMEVTLLVRPRSSNWELPSHGQTESSLRLMRRHLGREEFARIYGADPQDLARVEDFAGEHGLDVVETSVPRRTVVVSGLVAAVAAAFNVELKSREPGLDAYRKSAAPVPVPAELDQIVIGIFGLDDRHEACPRAEGEARERGTASSTRFPREVAQYYDFPLMFRGRDQCIAIIAVDGGYRTDDLRIYFSQLAMPAPKVVAVSVDGAHNEPMTSGRHAVVEVTADIEIAAAIAPDARFVVYFAPNTERGWVDVLTTAIHDSLHRPSVISISWSAIESRWSAQALQVLNRAFLEAAAMGVTICCAAGNDGAREGQGNNLAPVVFPASSPFVLACGGTHLKNSPDGPEEMAWDDLEGGSTGGGFSDVFDEPEWQARHRLREFFEPEGSTGRGLPDVAGIATGYRIRVHGEDIAFHGTSAVAPLWAGLVALFNEYAGKPVGFLNPFLYGEAATAGAFRNITRRATAPDRAGGGWNPHTGLGSPCGAKLLTLIRNL
jgi:kumamolisin